MSWHLEEDKLDGLADNMATLPSKFAQIAYFSSEMTRVAPWKIPTYGEPRNLQETHSQQHILQSTRIHSYLGHTYDIGGGDRRSGTAIKTGFVKSHARTAFP
jgi:hypothetical protein